MLLRCQSTSMAGVGNSGGKSKPMRENRTSNHACSAGELLKMKDGTGGGEGLRRRRNAASARDSAE